MQGSKFRNYPGRGISADVIWGKIYEKEENVEEKGRWGKYSQRQNWKDKDKINAK
jgi:hypothetical protein